MDANSDRAIALVYSALLGETGWGDVVDEVASAAAVDMATLFYHDADSGWGALTLTSGISDEVERDYSGHFAPLNPWMSQIFSTPIGEGIVGEQILARDTLVRSEYYNDFLRRHGQETSVGVTVRRDDNCFFLLSVLSGDTDFARNTRRARYLTSVAPHLRRVSDFYRRQANVAFGDGFANGLSEAGGVATVVVNAAARVIHASPLGEQALAAGSPLSIGPAGTVSFGDSLAQSVFVHALRGRYSDLMTRTVSAGETDVTFVRVAEDQGSAIFMGGALAILMTPREKSATRDVERVALKYRLTPAEKRVLAGILDGQRPAEIASAASVSLETIRSQLKAIYGKTGTDRQSALVRLATGLT